MLSYESGRFVTGHLFDAHRISSARAERGSLGKIVCVCPCTPNSWFLPIPGKVVVADQPQADRRTGPSLCPAIRIRRSVRRLTTAAASPHRRRR